MVCYLQVLLIIDAYYLFSNILKYSYKKSFRNKSFNDKTLSEFKTLSELLIVVFLKKKRLLHNNIVLIKQAFYTFESELGFF